jgi:hypothetical protein
MGPGGGPHQFMLLCVGSILMVVAVVGTLCAGRPLCLLFETQTGL